MKIKCILFFVIFYVVININYGYAKSLEENCYNTMYDAVMSMGCIEIMNFSKNKIDQVSNQIFNEPFLNKYINQCVKHLSKEDQNFVQRKAIQDATDQIRAYHILGCAAPIERIINRLGKVGRKSAILNEALHMLRN